MAESPLGIDVIGSFMNKAYLETRDIKMITSRDPRGTPYIIDGAKMQSLSNILSFEMNKVILKQSNIHGMGVFARTDINEGGIVTFYPGDVVEYTPNEDRDSNDHVVFACLSDREKSRSQTVEAAFKDNNYAFSLSKKYTMIGNPFFNSDPSYMGHLINDGAKSGSSSQSVALYQKITLLKRNCEFYDLHDLHLAVVACRDIKEGEELFVSYGPDYWECHNRRQTTGQ